MPFFSAQVQHIANLESAPSGSFSKKIDSKLGERGPSTLMSSHDASLFPRLVRGWINADFLVQIRFFFSINFLELYKKIIFSEIILQKEISNFAGIYKTSLPEDDFLVDLEKINAEKC